MKYSSLFICFLLSSSFLIAQKRSCDNAYRFDAAYTKTIDQLDNVNIVLYQPKPATEKVPASRNSSSYYYVSGTTSSKQFHPVDANIGFRLCYMQPSLELYKAEVSNGNRTFTIPAGTNGYHSVNIPIQVQTPPMSPSGTRGVSNWGPGYFKVKFTNGYLSPGEYILIDKESILPDGSQMKGYAFTII
jgi:hypothetical protein